MFSQLEWKQLQELQVCFIAKWKSDKHYHSLEVKCPYSIEGNATIELISDEIEQKYEQKVFLHRGNDQDTSPFRTTILCSGTR